MRIIAIQHTESEHHINKMVGSWTDWSLTKSGLITAERIADNLVSNFSFENDLIVSSDLLRCSCIAEILKKKTQCEMQIIKELRGKNYGAACGHSDEWLEKNRNPYPIFDARDVEYRYVEDAENTVELYQRMEGVFRKWLENGRNIIYVAHGDALNVFYAWWLDIPVLQLQRSDLFSSSGSVSEFYTLSDSKRLAIRIGDMSFALENRI